MFSEEKNLKDSQKDIIKDPERKLSASYGAGTSNMSIILSYTKTNKLITALYMVTDIIDKDEPLRNKLRTLGTEIISDISFVPSNVCSRISDIVSFLDIASAVNIISEMNSSILKKEFLELDKSIKEFTGEIKNINKQIDISEFFENSPDEFPPLLSEEGEGGGNSFITTSPFGHSSSTRRREISKGHTRIGVQRGSTLLKAIKNMSDRMPAPYEAEGFHSGFDKLKKQRRDDIIYIIKTIGGNATIKDIKDTAKSLPAVEGLPAKVGSLTSCGEKTLQRELVSMVKDGVLKKTGDKRWSRYELVSRN